MHISQHDFARRSIFIFRYFATVATPMPQSNSTTRCHYAHLPPLPFLPRPSCRYIDCDDDGKMSFFSIDFRTASAFVLWYLLRRFRETRTNFSFSLFSRLDISRRLLATATTAPTPSSLFLSSVSRRFSHILVETGIANTQQRNFPEVSKFLPPCLQERFLILFRFYAFFIGHYHYCKRLAFIFVNYFHFFAISTMIS